MTQEEIKQRLGSIRACMDDNESAHCMEDSLRGDFILYVANNGGELAEMAKLILTSDDFNFTRWYA